MKVWRVALRDVKARGVERAVFEDLDCAVLPRTICEGDRANRSKSESG